MSLQTWIRVEDDYAQFDHPKGHPLPEGVTEVADYPEHHSRWARQPKRRTKKNGTKTTKSQAKDAKTSDPSDDPKDEPASN